MRASDRGPGGARPRSGRRAFKAGIDRPRAILAAAEHLFAAHGYHAVSLRRIADEAGVPLALVDYHFGRKHALFDAVIARGRGNVEARVAALQGATGDAGRQPRDLTLEHIVEAFVAPVLSRRKRASEKYALLAARELLMRDTPTSRRILRSHFDPMAHAFIDALHRIFPDTSRGDAAWCYQFALGALVHHVTDTRVERLSRGENRHRDPSAAPLLVRFIVGGMLSVLDPGPRAHERYRGALLARAAN